MKNGLKAALSGLLIFAIPFLMFSIWIYEFMPAALQAALLVLSILLIVSMLVMLPKYFARRKKNKEDVLVQRIRQTFESAQLSDQPQPEDILYLRPFHVDDTYMSELEYAGKHYYTVESVICRMVDGSGHPVAIGRPGEELQPLGAHRVYAPDDQWQQKVKEYFECAKCVILYADFTPGVTWEIETALSRYKDKLVLIPKVYNQKQSLFRKITMLDPTALLDLIYALQTNVFVRKKARRGSAYYRSWNKLMKGHMKGIKMNDKVSAVIFENGKPIAFHTRKPSQEEQFLAIHRALRRKLGMEPRQELFLQKGEKPLLTVCADLGIKNAHLASFYPYAMGHLEFYAEGLRYKNFASFMRFNQAVKESYKTLTRYRKNQLIPYSAIENVIPINESCLQLVLEEANGSMYLTVPKYHCICIPALRKFLNRCRGEDRFCPAESEALAQLNARQRKDYTCAFWFTELLSLVLGAALLLPALAGNYLAFFCLVIYGGIWNLCIALNGYIFLRGSASRLTKVLGSLIALVHLILSMLLMAQLQG